MRAVVLFGMAVLLPFSALKAETLQTSAGAVTVQKIVDRLNRPWSFAFLPDGGLLITERDVGKIWHVGTNDTRRELEGVPDVASSGQGGLFDIVLARDFASTRTVFVSYAERNGGGQHTALATARLDPAATKLTDLKVIFRMSESGETGRHFGGRIVEANDGSLFMTIGDRAHRPSAQDPRLHNGKVIRVNRDGSRPSDNPYRYSPTQPQIWSSGHRNPQGAALDEKGRLWTVSHGAAGGDEVNMPEAGKNYGWPVISYGEHYWGGQIGIGTSAPGYEQPKFYWDPSIAPSGMMIYSGKMFPAWRGDIFVGSLKFDYLSRLDRNDATITGEERLFQDRFERIRDVREGPDGSIWFLSVGDKALYRMSAVQ